MKIFLQACSILFLLSGCASYEKFRQVTDEFEIPSQIYRADYNQTWRAVLQVMKRYDIATQNQEAGFIKSRWMDNTLEVNFTDSFGGKDKVKAAKFKLVINVGKGFRESQEVTKVSVFKRQMVEQDFLQGWKEVPTDSITEKAILYRIERSIAIDNELNEIDRLRQKEQEEKLSSDT